MDQITVVHQFADQGIDLAQTERGLGTTLKVATHETIFVHAHLEGGRASFIDGRGAILFGERENAQDAAHAHFALLAIDKVAKGTDRGAHSAGAAEQLHHPEGSAAGGGPRTESGTSPVSGVHVLAEVVRFWDRRYERK